MMLTRVAPTRHLCLETDLLKYQYCTIYREKNENCLKNMLLRRITTSEVNH